MRGKEPVLTSVREEPHLSTALRAHKLAMLPTTVQRLPKERGLSKLTARLKFVGYQVERCEPLQAARQGRIVAAYPGSLTHIDFKTLAFLQGRRGHKSVRLGAFCVIDSLTAHASVTLASSPTGVEALNKTPKYQCFPAIAGNVATWGDAVRLVRTWMVYYSKKRAHTGHVNRGLPPQAGQPRRRGVRRRLDRAYDGRQPRRRGPPLPKRVAGPERCQGVDGLPFALVLERAGAHGDLSPTEVEHPVPSQVPPPVHSGPSLS